MKKLVLYAAILVTTSGFCQEAATEIKTLKPVRGTLKLGPFEFIANTLSLGIEKSIGSDNSLQIYPSVILSENNNSEIKEKNTGISIELQYKKFIIPGKTEISGMYTGIFARYLNLETRTELTPSYYSNPYYGYNYSYQTPPKSKYVLDQFSGGFLVGYQWVINSILVFDFYAGGGIKLSDSNHDYYMQGGNLYPFYRHYTGIFPKFGIKAGITI